MDTQPSRRFIEEVLCNCCAAFNKNQIWAPPGIIGRLFGDRFWGISMASPTERNAAGLATVTEILRRGIGEIIKMLAMSAVWVVSLWHLNLTCATINKGTGNWGWGWGCRWGWGSDCEEKEQWSYPWRLHFFVYLRPSGEGRKLHQRSESQATAILARSSNLIGVWPLQLWSSNNKARLIRPRKQKTKPHAAAANMKTELAHKTVEVKSRFSRPLLPPISTSPPAGTTIADRFTFTFD